MPHLQNRAVLQRQHCSGWDIVWALNCCGMAISGILLFLLLFVFYDRLLNVLCSLSYIPLPAVICAVSQSLNSPCPPPGQDGAPQMAVSLGCHHRRKDTSGVTALLPPRCLGPGSFVFRRGLSPVCTPRAGFSRLWPGTSGVPQGSVRGLSYLTSLSVILMRGLSAPSVSLQVTPCWEGVLICWRGERHYGGTWIDWIDGPRLTI